MTETMSSTPTDASTPVDRTFPVAMLMLSTHMLEHQLPMPVAIAMPSAINWPAAIGVHLSRHDNTQLFDWVASIHVDQRYVEDERHNGRAYAYDHWIGRLPDSGVRVDLYAAILEPAVLQVVPS